MKDSKVICLFSFSTQKSGDKYHNYAKNLITKIKEETSIPIILLTDKPNYYDEFDVDVFEYNKLVPSFIDKIRICNYALGKYDVAIYLDTDTTFDFKLLEDIKFSNGFHFWWWWKVNWRIYDHLENKDYFKDVEEYCIRKKLNYKNAELIHEGFFVIKKDNNLNKFFEIVYDLGIIMEKNDLKSNNIPIGRAEGLCMGISLLNSGFKNNGCSKEMMILGHNLQQHNSPEKKHLRDKIEGDILKNKTLI